MQYVRINYNILKISLTAKGLIVSATALTIITMASNVKYPISPDLSTIWLVEHYTLEAVMHYKSEDVSQHPNGVRKDNCPKLFITTAFK